MRTFSQIRATGGPGLLVAFGREEDASEETWCMLLDPASLATIARTGREVVFTARELVAPHFNPDLFWVVTLLFGTEVAAQQAEARLRKLSPAEFFQGHDLTGIIAQCGHSLQSIGVPDAELDVLARRRGLTLTLVSPKDSQHRDYYAVSAG